MSLKSVSASEDIIRDLDPIDIYRKSVDLCIWLFADAAYGIEYSHYLQKLIKLNF